MKNDIYIISDICYAALDFKVARGPSVMYKEIKKLQTLLEIEKNMLPPPIEYEEVQVEKGLII
jgi:hypothetical protein